jgi:hypothetical protein
LRKKFMSVIGKKVGPEMCKAFVGPETVSEEHSSGVGGWPESVKAYVSEIF